MAIARRPAQQDESALTGVRLLVVEARYYDDIANLLLAGAVRVLDAARVQWDLVTVPGALEIPAATAIALDTAVARRAPYEGVVALGCIIRGETSHYDIVAGESARAIMDLSVTRSLPIGNGVLTVDTRDQAEVRAKPGKYDKGAAAASATLSLVRLKRRLAPARGRR